MEGSATLRRRFRDIRDFGDSLERLLAALTRGGYDGALVAALGREQEVSQLVGSVDRVAGRAAQAFADVGISVTYKPPGTWQTRPVNPAQAWATIMEPYPMFGPDVILACCNQALGLLEGQIELAEENEGTVASRVQRAVAGPRGVLAALRGAPREATSHPSAFLTGVIVTVIGGLIVAFLAHRFGWV